MYTRLESNFARSILETSLNYVYWAYQGQQLGVREGTTPVFSLDFSGPSHKKY
jgi:hypothetical protein